MTDKEWLCFIAFTIAINVIMQVLAWNIAYKICSKADKRGKNDE